jgi:hypothetical protein
MTRRRYAAPPASEMVNSFRRAVASLLVISVRICDVD